MKRGQSISLDAIIGVALFTVALIFFFSLSSDNIDKQKVESLETQSNKLVTGVAGKFNTSGSLVDGSKVNEARMKDIYNLTPDELKRYFGVSAEFCLFFEDQEGNVLNISGNKTAIGSSGAAIAGVACNVQP
jgi:hypothetical protein